MAFEGRIEGRVSADRQTYELVQRGTVRQAIPISEVHADERLKARIAKNGWEMP